MAEGSREQNDAVALAKIASSLDVLACGGKFTGIISMLTHLTGWKAEDEITTGSSPLSLKRVVKDVYDNGRSQILHGTHFDRIKSFETQRGHAAWLARFALIVCAERLMNFTGEDSHIGFRTI
jgi:hypothetical protein